MPDHTTARVLERIERHIKKHLVEGKHYKIFRGKLWWLNLSKTKIRDLSPLSGLTDLEYLDLSLTDVSNLEPLSGLTNLKTLDLGGCWRVRDISPLAKFEKLESLKLGGTQVRDLSPLRSLKNLREIELSSCYRLRDLSPLIDLRKRYWRLEEVRLGGKLSLSTTYGNGIAVSMWTIPLTYGIISDVSRSLGIAISIKAMYSVLTVMFIYAFLLFAILIPTFFYVYPINSLKWRLLIVLSACTTYCVSYPLILRLFLGQPIIAYFSK